jgi:hypothetical protein
MRRGTPALAGGGPAAASGRRSPPYGLRMTAAAAATAVVVALLPGLFGGGPGPATRSVDQAPPPNMPGSRDQGLEALPLAARGPVSDFLGARDPHFALHGLGGRIPTQGFGLRFAPSGVTVSAGGAHLDVGLSAYGRPGAMRNPPKARPTARGNEVTYRRGGLIESYADGPLGLEQSFELDSRPAGHGPLTFLSHLPPVASLQVAHGRVLIVDHGQELRYDDLVVTDADGRRVPATLAVEGDDIAVKVHDAGAVYPLHVDPLLQKAVLINPGAADDGYGTSVAITGSTIAVGDPYADDLKGAAYVFEEPAGGWATSDQPAATFAGQGTEGEYFGNSVALSGTTLVAGAPYHKVGSYFYGAAYVFREPASDDWSAATERARLEGPVVTQGEEEFFGEHVAVAGQTIAVSAPGRLDNIGDVFVYREPNAGWQSTSSYGALLHGPAFTMGQGCPQFGDGLALAEHGSQATVVVGEPGVYSEDGASCEHPLAGHVYVFTSPSGGWTTGAEYEGTALSSGSTATKDRFGESVSVSAEGEFVLAGAPGQTVAGRPEAGAAYLFTRPGGGWTGSPTPATITGPEAIEDAHLGQTVVLASDGSRLAVDQDGHDAQPEFKPGSDLIYDRPTGAWASTSQPSEELLGNEEEDLNITGRGLGLEGQTVVNGGSYDVAAGGTTVLVYGPGLGIDIESPADNAEYTPGQALTASYHCVAPTGATITRCEGPVPSGQVIDTSGEGAYAFTVNAEDSLGATSSRTVHYLIARASSNPPSSEPVSKEAAQQTKTDAQIVAEEEAHAARLKQEFKEFVVYVQYVLSHPAPIASLLRYGAEASRSLVPEPAWIETSGKAFSWGLPKASANAMSLATASSVRGKKSVLAFSHKLHVTKAGKVALKVPLTAAGRKLAERAITEHHPLKVNWTLTVRPAKSPALTRHFTVSYEPGRRRGG